MLKTPKAPRRAQPVKAPRALQEEIAKRVNVLREHPPQAWRPLTKRELHANLLEYLRRPVDPAHAKEERTARWYHAQQAVLKFNGSLPKNAPKDDAINLFTLRYAHDELKGYPTTLTFANTLRPHLGQGRMMANALLAVRGKGLDKMRERKTRVFKIWEKKYKQPPTKTLSNEMKRDPRLRDFQGFRRSPLEQEAEFLGKPSTPAREEPALKQHEAFLTTLTNDTMNELAKRHRLTNVERQMLPIYRDTLSIRETARRAGTSWENAKQHWYVLLRKIRPTLDAFNAAKANAQQGQNGPDDAKK